MSDAVVATGRCLCGAVSFEATGQPLWVVHCHCESCRRQTGSAAATFVGFRLKQVAFATSMRRVFSSSPGVERTFCARCGSPVSYEADRFPGEIHMYISLFDQPGRFVPERHVHYDEHLPWLQLDPHLPHEIPPDA
jgi:hypothetical protein